MSSITTASATNSVTTMDRKALVRGLERARLVVPGHCVKPILTCVHLEACNGTLVVRATDGETTAHVQARAEGELPACVVSCAELIRRLKVRKSSVCMFTRSADGEQLVMNGGRVEHSLQTQRTEDFPAVPSQLDGDSIDVAAAAFVRALKVASCAAAREPTRYAIDGILLESDKSGTRLAATDGRRLVVVEIPGSASGFEGAAILPIRMTRLIEKFTEKRTDFLVLAVQREKREGGEPPPGRVYAAGPDWLLSSFEHEGRFPVYRDVVPKSGSRFAVEQTALVETLSEVSLAANEDSRMVRVDLSAHQVRLSAGAPGVGRSEATLPAKHLGGGDPEIHTAFNPSYLQDALATLSSDEVVIDVGQNGYGSDGKVFGMPALLYGKDDLTIRWVVMPVNAGLEPTRANLGSNFHKVKANQGQ